MWLFFLSNLGMGASSGTAAPPIALNLDPWSCTLLSDDTDPLAVDPSQATQVN